MDTGAVIQTTPASVGEREVEGLLGEESGFEGVEQPPVEIIEHKQPLLEAMREAWDCRHLFWQIASSALLAYIVRFRLGPTWILLQVFMPLLGFSLIFGGGVFNVKAPNGMPYFLYMMVGMMGWQLFNTTLNISARSFLRLRSLVRNLHIPLVLIPIAGSAQALLRFFLYLSAYVIAIVYFWIKEGRIYAQLQPKYLALSILGLSLCVLLAWGISFWTAPLTVHTRDVRMALKFAMPFWMFVTPVLYPIDHLRGKTRLIAELNPVSSPVEMAKVGMLGAGSVHLVAAIWSIALIAGVFASGVWFVSRHGARFAGLREDIDEDDEEMMM
jgi:ABC-type polysaccharide/polyol phosphate export permease